MLFVFCGLPGSGKTTHSKWLAKQFDGKLYCYDNLPYAHHPKYHRKVHWQMYADIAKDLQNGFTVVVDDLHTRKQWRQDVLATASGLDCRKILVIMDTPLEECIHRNANRKARLPDFVLWNEAQKYEPPSLDEGWDEIILA